MEKRDKDAHDFVVSQDDACIHCFNEGCLLPCLLSQNFFYTIILVLVIIIRLSLMNHETEKTPSGQVSILH